jgi:hypothetical protein
MHLDEWLEAHGPLWPSAAAVIALDVCAQASTMTPQQLRQVIVSLNTGNVNREAGGGWSWRPLYMASASEPASDDDVVERLGALLFHCCTGHTLSHPAPDEQSLRMQVRAVRPELPPSIADLIIEALDRQGNRPTLDAFARDLRQTAGVRDSRRAQPASVTAGVLAAFAVALAMIVGWLWSGPAAEERVQGFGLTRNETALVDSLAEAAHTLALIDEHTVALQHLQEIGRLWRARLAPDDSRLAWNEAQEAWVRALAGDRLTTEQLLADKPSRLSAQLGGDHPYARTVRLGLASTLKARGATVEANALVGDAQRATSRLLADRGLSSVTLDANPVPLGVLAHVSPNQPEKEGFRFDTGEGYFMPLTSTQHVTSVRAGWRLHLAATDSCRVSFVAGADPRRVTIATEPVRDGLWRVRIDGTKSPVAVETTAPRSTLGLTVIASNSSAELNVRVGARTFALGPIDSTRPRPVVPYKLSFIGGPHSDGCSLVWLEIPFPSGTRFGD